MVAVESRFCPPEQRRNRRVLQRLVAVAVTPGDLRNGSDLAVRLAGVGHVDLLMVTDGDDRETRSVPDTEEDDDVPDPGERLRLLAADLGHPDLQLHRLGLPSSSVPAPRPRDVDDVVAAISELVGFDPDPDVGCAVPLGPAPTAAGGPAEHVVGRAIERIVAAYRLPVITYLPAS